MDKNEITAIQDQIQSLLRENFQIDKDFFNEQIQYLNVASRIEGVAKKSLVDDLYEIKKNRNSIIHKLSDYPSDESVRRLYSRIQERIIRFAAPELENVPYFIINKNSGRLLDDPWEFGNGKIHQWGKHGGKNQQWIIRKTINGNYLIISNLSGKCLGIENESLEQPAWLELNYYSGKPNQQFQFTQLDDGAYSISVVHSGLCLDVSGADIDDGAWITQWDWHGGNNQRWYINPAF